MALRRSAALTVAVGIRYHPPVRDVTLIRAGELSLVDLAALFTASFAGYAVPVSITAEALASQLRVDGVDLARSRVARVAGAPAGLLLLAPRGWGARVAAMGVVADARRRGLGQLMLDAVIDDLEIDRYRALTLEVIASNHPAIALYRGRGFRSARRLVGHTLRGEAALGGRDHGPLVEVDPAEVAAAVLRFGEADLPWQLRGESLIAHGPPTQGWRLGAAAWALTSASSDGAVTLLALVVAGERRREGLASALVCALVGRSSIGELRVPPRVPAGLAAEFFRARGFAPAAIRQLEMVRALAGCGSGESP